MTASARAALAAGVVALTGSAVAFTPSVLPATMSSVQVVRPVAFAAGTAPTKPVAEDVRAALEFIGQLRSARNPGMVTVDLGGDQPKTGVESGIADLRDDGGSHIDGRALDGPVAFNAASDLIDRVYSVTRYWANYVSLDLGPWLINWIPFGYLVSDQIQIWYPAFVLPVVDSFVYDFLDPVVNDPLNLNVWLDGLGNIVNTALTGVYNGIVSEVRYVLDFGWFPIPLPPLPNFPLPSAAVSADGVDTLSSAVADETEGAEEATDQPAQTADDPAEKNAEAPAQEETGSPEVSGDDGQGEGTTPPVEDVDPDTETEPEEPAEDADTGAELDEETAGEDVDPDAGAESPEPTDSQDDDGTAAGDDTKGGDTEGNDTKGGDTAGAATSGD